MDSFRATLRRRVLSRGSAVLAAAAALWAQNPSGEVTLHVEDPSGAPMQVSGTLQGQTTAVSRTFQTDSQGMYTFQGLPYGRYRLEVSKDGFATQSLLVNIQTDTPLSRTLTMQLSSQAAKVDVVAPTPLAGTDLAIDEIPAPVQTVTARAIQDSGALDLSDLLNQRLDGVHINENQENPFQPDVNYRGYTASPLLGTPEGISVYMDGVRQNQPFGDIVAWDLIPKIAIYEVALMPGSNPLFGLNTLGGALSIQTKDGISHPASRFKSAAAVSDAAPASSNMAAPIPKD